MRPIQLEMKGFGTFRDATTIDFDGVDLVALVGPTGSGKSTIIDAITFALFGSVARYDDGRLVAPIICQLANEARVRLDFELAGTRYTAVRVVRRTKNGATTREARLESGDDTLAGNASELTAEVGRLLGLDFDRFTKTVVLPQGKFAAFLHDGPTERQELLRQLLGLGVYSRMGQAARQRATRAKAQLDVLEPRLGGAVVVSDDEVVALIERVDAAAAAVPRLDAIVARLATTVADAKAAREAAESLGIQSQTAASVRVPPDVAELARHIADAHAEVSQADQALALATEEREKAEAAAASGPDAAHVGQLIAERRRADAVATELAALAAAVVSADAHRSAAVGSAEEARAHLADLTARVADTRARLHQAEVDRDEGPDAVALDATRRLVADRVAAAEVLVDLVDTANATGAAAERALDARDAVSARLAEVDSALSAAITAQGAAGMVAELVVGAACPVCRQVVSSIPDHEIDGELATARHERALAAGELADRQQALEAAQSARATAEARRDAVIERLAILDRQLDGAPTATELDRDQAEATRRAAVVAELTAATRADEAARHTFESDPGTIAAFEAERVAADRALLAKAQHDAKSAESATLAERLDGTPTIDVLEAAAIEANRLVLARRAAVEAETAARTRRSSATATSEQLQATERRERAGFDATRDRLVTLSPPAPGNVSLADDWHELATWAVARATGLHTELAAVRARVAEIEAERVALDDEAHLVVAPFLVDHGHDDTSDEAAVDKLPSILVRATERARAAVERAEGDRAAVAQLRAEVDGLKVDRAVADELGHLLRADGFERWLMEGVVDDLVDRATDRLVDLSGGQYSLVAEGAVIKVRDHRNADEVRDVKTLSGGETFLASLALALGLADALGELSDDAAPALESIFLDEGFGTLDPETLDVVAVAIEELGASGGMVGIVTHIRELAERMPARFEVSKGPTSSSVERVEV